jgi:hypothetical protein
MINDPRPIDRKPADRPISTGDLETLVQNLRAALRDAVRDTQIVRDDLVNGKPPSRLIARSVEAFEGVAHANEVAEQLALACRDAGLFSVEWEN